jgi:branched-chain amino acid transport system substrate-binding protein
MKLGALAIGLVASQAVAASGALAASNDVVIGDIDDLSGPYADIQGPAAVDAVKMAIADFGGTVPARLRSMP